MTAKGRAKRDMLIGALRAGVAVCALGVAMVAPAHAQSVLPAPAGVGENQRLLLASEQLIYNNDTGVVTAIGNVQIDYGPYKLVAERVEYNQNNGRMRASGNVQMIEPDGNIIYADELDVTDDFADGFINALRIETPDRTRIAAESAERSGGVETTFNNGVYTACEPCKDDPERAPLWQVKARKVIHNSQTQTIRLERATFELFGMPIATLPYLELPDHRAKRKTGFLFPSFNSSETLGYAAKVPFYVAISPHMDATITGTGYTRQGFLLEGEFRQRFANGSHVLRMAGISQTSPDAFTPATSDALVRERGLIASKAEFQINPRWTFGWDVMLQSDNNFGRTYGIGGYSDSTQTSKIYLTGLAKRSYFDLRGYKFDIQNADETNTAERQEAVVHPVLDYNHILSQPVAGGELALNVNGQSLSRDREEVLAGRYIGTEGNNARLTTELEWKRTFTAPSGFLLTPILAARGDFNAVNTSSTPPSLIAGNSASRGMVTAGLEASYPILATTENSSHVIEPVAQIFVRPDERLAGGLPNEDAQSFVFDATTLFDRDKFSGYDRMEGGTRANVGIRYTGSFNNGVTTHATFGQSYQLAGLNSFSTPDLVGAGMDSGLETKVSDYVGMVGLSTSSGLTLAATGRFDKDNFRLERGDLTAGFSYDKLSTSMTYSEVKAQTGYGSTENRREISGTASLRFADYWSVSGSTSYDLVDNKFNRSGLGLNYEDECYSLALTYERLRDDTNTNARDWKIGARMSFRTLGDIDLGETN